jgi:hypothetical protein
MREINKPKETIIIATGLGFSVNLEEALKEMSPEKLME